MPKFKYRAMNQTGEKIEGDYEADFQDQVLAMISDKGYYPLKIEEVVESAKIEISLFEPKVKIKDIAIFCRQFYTMLDAGITLNHALNILGNQITNKTLKAAILKIEEDVKKGEMLSDSMKKFPNVFPALLISMVESGELSGRLDEIMLRMSTHFEKENKVNNKVKSAMIYPIILGIVAVAAIVVIMTFVMPTFVDMFAESGTELPALTKMLISTSEFMSTRWYIILGILVVLVVAFNIFKKTDAGEITLSRLKLKIPGINKLNQMIIVSRFTRTLSTLLASGVTLMQCLDIISEVVGNRVAKDALHKVREEVFRGEGLYNPMKESGIFPEMLYSMIKIGEETGALDSIMNKTADFYDDELEQTIQSTVAMIEPAMIIVMGIGIGTIVLAIMIPMFTMYGTM